MALDPIGVIFMAKDLATATITQLERKFKSLDQTVQNSAQNFGQGMALMGSGLAVMGAGAGLLAPLVIGTKRAGDLEEALLMVRKITGPTGVDLAGLRDTFVELAPALGRTATEMAQVAFGAAQLGIKGNQNLSMFSVSAIKMATALDMSVEQTSTQGAKLLNVFKLSTDQLENLGSAFNEMANNSAASASEIVDSSFRAAGSMQLLGATADQVAALSTVLIETGLTGDIAGTSLRRAFEMATTHPKKLAAAMGVSTQQIMQMLGKDAVGTILKFSEKMGAMPNKAEALGQAVKIFGEEGAKSVVRLGSNLERVNELMALSKKGFIEGTSLTKEFEAITVGFNFSMKQLLSQFVSLAQVLGTALLPILTPLVKMFTSFVGQIVKAITPIKGFVAGAIAMAGSFMLIVGGIVAMKGAWMALNGILLIVGMSIGGVAVAFAQAALAVALIGVAVFAVMKNVGGLGDFFGDVFNKVKLFFTAVRDLMGGGEISEELNKQLEEAGVAEFVDITLRLFSRAKAFLSNFFEGFLEGIEVARPGMTVFFDAIKFAISGVIELGSKVLVWIDAVLGGFLGAQGAIEAFGIAGGTTGATLGNIFGFLINIVARLFSLIPLALGGVLTVLDMIGAAIGAVVFLLMNPLDAIKLAWMEVMEFIGSAVEGISANPVVKFALSKMGIDTESKVEPVGAQAPGAPEISPDLGVEAAASGIQAQKFGSEAMVSAMGEIGNGGMPSKIEIPVMIDGREIGKAVKNFNQRETSRAGGQR